MATSITEIRNTIRTDSNDIKYQLAAEWLAHFRRMEAVEIAKANGRTPTPALVDPRGWRLNAAKMAASYRQDIVAAEARLVGFASADRGEV